MVFVLPNGFFALEHIQELLAFYLASGQIGQERTSTSRTCDFVDLADKIFRKNDMGSLCS
jgi:hypothetical protein